MAGRFNVDEYVPVQERINLFWQEHPNGTIKTKLEDKVVDAQGGILEVIFSAVVDTGDHPGSEHVGRAVCTGWGSESRADFPAAFIEKAETKAIGRAMANLGYAKSSTDRPSSEEMDSANRRIDRQQQPPQARRRPAEAPAQNGTGGASEYVQMFGLDLEIPQQRDIWAQMIERSLRDESEEKIVSEWRNLANYARWTYGRDNKQLWRMVDLMLNAPNQKILDGLRDLALKEGMDGEGTRIAHENRTGVLNESVSQG